VSGIELIEQPVFPRETVEEKRGLRRSAKGCGTSDVRVSSDTNDVKKNPHAPWSGSRWRGHMTTEARFLT